MSRREDIDNAIWSDPDFLALTAGAKLVYLWSFTNPRCGMSGLYKVVTDAIIMETGLTAAKVRDALAELAQGRFVFYDGRVMWVRSRVKHLRAKSPNMRKAIVRELEGIGSHDLVAAFVEAYRSQPFLEGFLEPFRNGSNPSNGSGTFQGTGNGTGLQKGPSSSSPSTLAADESATGDVVEDQEPESAPVVRFSGKPVPSGTLLVAQHIVANFNRQAGTSYEPFAGDGSPSENLKRVLGALRRWPAITAEVGDRMIRGQLARPYWGHARPHLGHVFGPGVVEQNLQEATGGGSSASSDELRRKLLGPNA